MLGIHLQRNHKGCPTPHQWAVPTAHNHSPLSTCAFVRSQVNRLPTTTKCPASFQSRFGEEPLEPALELESPAQASPDANTPPSRPTCRRSSSQPSSAALTSPTRRLSCQSS